MTNAIAHAVDFANLTPVECCTLSMFIENTLAPGANITAQFLITMQNIAAKLPEINENRAAIFAIAYIEQHPFYAGRTIQTA